MRSSPVIGLVLMIGAGVVWVAGKEACHETAGCRKTVQPGVALEKVPQQNAPASVQASVPVTNQQGGNRDQAPAQQAEGSADLVARVAKGAASEKVAQTPAQVGGRLALMKVTAYCCCRICCEAFSGGGRTSIGKDANIFDGVAADPKLLPYHTRLDIPGVGIREVDDTGGAMRQDAKKGIVHIDVRMASHAEARRFGVRWLEVKVLR